MHIEGDARHQDNVEKWHLIDLLESGDILLDEDWRDHLYYPEKNCDAKEGSKESNKTSQRQIDFIAGAQLFPAVARTINGSVGSVFRKPTVITLTPKLKYLEKNTDGSGVGLEQVTQLTTARNIAHGYGGLLTDFADVQGGKTLSADESEKQGRQATINFYDAESILRVGIKKKGSINVIHSIVLSEDLPEESTIFEEIVVQQFRVLTFDEDGFYVQYIYRVDDNGKTSNDFDTIEPKDGKGQRLTEIPFDFVGAQSNSWKVDDAPMYPMATLNSKHVEYSAMRNESIRQLAPTLFAETQEGFDAKQFKEDNPHGIRMGAYSGYFGFKSATIVQPLANDAALSDMNRLENDMVQAGALLVTPDSSNISTETTAIQKSTETSVLGIIVRNSESAMNNQLIWAARFMNAPEEGNTVAINRDFIDTRLTAQQRTAWANDVMSGNVSRLEYRIQLERSGEIDDAEAMGEDLE